MEINFTSRMVLATLLVATLSASAVAQQTNEQKAESTDVKRSQVVDKGLNWLATQEQAEDGTFTAKAGAGITALAVTAALRNDSTLNDPIVKKGLKALEGFVKPDGGIYGSGRLKNYETCVAMVCFAEANKDGRFDDILKRAKSFVTGIQYGKANGKNKSDVWYGGVGYSGAERPDLSNTSYLIEALRAAGSEENDDAIQQAIAFVSRCQNLEGHGNDTEFAALVNDGGFYYEIPTTKIDPSTSPERFTPEGGIRSYGTMTYAGLKSMIYAGLTKDDPRVAAAVEWIQKQYAVDKNPGMGSAGLYYYFNTFAASLKTAEIETVKDKDGKTHDWRKDLVQELARRQNKDGSWSNRNERWFEGDKNLATSFALLALSYCNDEGDK
ncbi:prenyltransferase/squalene oxidase repeat-containing protein [Fuerstiella marisgermanici]|uniref:Squalene-hopene cyclase n=1 Tax=Fuerstiella marisgermanici TaxID=1891926 RepID=A0A1P8WR17_9PLAN|nr:prenyltransferase/squalene oxidase repeat-containing protein [Fuerstiella marisgermanici]APZ96495.1 squalene-hopene cyclase [Fuerstiella marisgermanici]